MSARDDFPRTTCACETCQSGCRTQPGFLGVGDAERIIAHVLPPRDSLSLSYSIEAEAFAQANFCASEGAVVARMNNGVMETFRIPTIVPQQKANGECVFFEAGRCGIHPVAPIGCSHCDTHMSLEAGHEVSAAVLQEILEPGGTRYRQQAAALKDRGIVARPLVERKAAYAALEAEIRARTANVTP